MDSGERIPSQSGVTVTENGGEDLDESLTSLLAATDDSDDDNTKTVQNQTLNSDKNKSSQFNSLADK